MSTTYQGRITIGDTIDLFKEYGNMQLPMLDAMDFAKALNKKRIKYSISAGDKESWIKFALIKK